MTPSQARNAIKRALRSIIDPELNDKDKPAIWNYFDNRCAYCDKELDKKDRNGHIDHLVPEGGNHISNHVLSCNQCNGDQKREKNWKDFLEMKCKSDATYKKRFQKIEEWRDSKWKISNSHDKIVISLKDKKILEDEIKKVNSQLEKSINALKKRKSNK